jgi:hypothetical protein
MALSEQGNIPPRNALVGRGSQRPPASRRLDLAPLLATAIGHAAMLSDTPEKWASTIAMLRSHGVDPEGYADFEKGRPAAVKAAGIALPDESTD